MFTWYCSKVLRSEIQMRIQDTPLQSNISKDSWCYPCNPLPSCCPRSSSRPNIEHSRQKGSVNVALRLSTSPICGTTKITYFNFARVILETFLQYSQSLWSFFFQLSWWTVSSVQGLCAKEVIRQFLDLQVVYSWQCIILSGMMFLVANFIPHVYQLPDYPRDTRNISIL